MAHCSSRSAVSLVYFVSACASSLFPLYVLCLFLDAFSRLFIDVKWFVPQHFHAFVSLCVRALVRPRRLSPRPLVSREMYKWHIFKKKEFQNRTINCSTCFFSSIMRSYNREFAFFLSYEHDYKSWLFLESRFYLNSKTHEFLVEVLSPLVEMRMECEWWRVETEKWRRENVSNMSDIQQKSEWEKIKSTYFFSTPTTFLAILQYKVPTMFRWCYCYLWLFLIFEIISI